MRKTGLFLGFIQNANKHIGRKLLVPNFQMVLELQAIKIENTNFHTKMDFFVLSNLMAHNSKPLKILELKLIEKCSTLMQSIEQKLWHLS